MPTPTPGSSNALVLPSAAVLEIEPTSGQQLSQKLEAFLEQQNFTAVAVVHGMGKWASPAFDRAKLRCNSHQGVVWVTNEDFLPHLTGPKADVLRKLLAPEKGFQMTFFRVSSQTVTGKLRWSQLGSADIDRELNRADQN